MLFVFTSNLISHFPSPFLLLIYKSCFFPSTPALLLRHFFLVTFLCPSFLLYYFLSWYFTCSLFFFHPTPLVCDFRQCSLGILSRAGGRWILSWLHSQSHAHLRAHTDLPEMVIEEQCQTTRLIASMLIRASQETSLGLLATAWHWLWYLPTSLLDSGRIWSTEGNVLFNNYNHKKWLTFTNQTLVQQLQFWQ